LDLQILEILSTSLLKPTQAGCLSAWHLAVNVEPEILIVDEALSV